MINKLIIVVFMFLLETSSYAQNLIANPNFSDRNICKEMNAACGPEAWFMASNSVPIGKKNTGVTIFNSSKKDLRQYLQTELLMEFKKDSIYEIKLTVLAGECLVNSLGVKFTEELTCLDSDKLITGADIDFSSQMNTLSKGKQQKWMDLTYSYKAKGGERFILLGCFAPDSQQNRNFKDKVTQYQNYSYFFNNVEVNATYLNDLPNECNAVKNHLYNFNYRHTHCMYVPYQKPIIIKDTLLVEKIKILLIDSLTLDDVLFDFNLSDLTGDAKSYLLEAIKTIDMETVTSIDVFGYTDNVGNDTYNAELSLKRAEAVKQFFNDIGYSEIDIKTTGLGEINPIAANSTEEGRKKNRRIEIVFAH